jgi:transcriptional regulator with XRE-family HTH domain
MNLDRYIQELRTRIHACPTSQAAIAAASGGELSLSWISKFSVGKLANPSVKSLQALAAALDRVYAP